MAPQLFVAKIGGAKLFAQCSFAMPTVPWPGTTCGLLPGDVCGSLGNICQYLPGHVCRSPCLGRFPVPCLGRLPVSCLATFCSGTLCQFPAWKRLQMPCLGMFGSPCLGCLTVLFLHGNASLSRRSSQLSSFLMLVGRGVIVTRQSVVTYARVTMAIYSMSVSTTRTHIRMHHINSIRTCSIHVGIK